MLLEVRHITEYTYDSPVRESVMELWMQPRATATQRVVSFDLHIDPPTRVFAYADSWGNTVSHFDIPAPHSHLNVSARSVVETEPPLPLPASLSMESWDQVRAESIRGECWDFLHPHGFIVDTPALRAFRETPDVAALTALDPLTAVVELNALLYRSFDYEAGVTAADSPIDHAILEGRGVCQDFAHIMIAICRAWDIPARYVSGYVHSRRGNGDRSDPDHSHAWVEVFLPGLRWIGFDPTNNTHAGERHIAVGIGRDYSDTPPSRGVFKGAAEGRLSVGVSVREAAVASPEPEFLQLGAPAIAAARRRAGTAAILNHRHQQQQQQQ